jgi:hypothetical protein
MFIIIIYTDFFTVLPEVLQDINNADYVAIDGEFTGILPFDKMGYFDTPSERYQRHYNVHFFISIFEIYIMLSILV